MPIIKRNDENGAGVCEYRCDSEVGEIREVLLIEYDFAGTRNRTRKSPYLPTSGVPVRWLYYPHPLQL